MPVKTIQLLAFKETHTFFDRRMLTVNWWEGSKAADVSKDIRWDPAKTRITSARMYCKIWTQFQSAAHIVFQDQELLRADGTWGDVTVEDIVDVMGLLVNGTNRCKAEIWKIVPVGKSAEFTAILEIEYEGEAPTVKPWWEKYLMYILAGTSVLLGAVGVGLALKKE